MSCNRGSNIKSRKGLWIFQQLKWKLFPVAAAITVVLQCQAWKYDREGKIKQCDPVARQSCMTRRCERSNVSLFCSSSKVWELQVGRAVCPQLILIRFQKLCCLSLYQFSYISAFQRLYLPQLRVYIFAYPEATLSDRFSSFKINVGMRNQSPLKTSFCTWWVFTSCIYMMSLIDSHKVQEV